jgi:hypothetical protein
MTWRLATILTRLFSSTPAKETGLPVWNPEEIVVALSEILKANPKTSDDDAMRFLEEKGVPSRLAVRAYLLAQLAWGRMLLLGRLKVDYSNQYVCFNGKGDVVERGRLSEEPCFVAAMQHWQNAIDNKHLFYTACGSTDVKALADALQGDGPKEGFKTCTTFLLLENLTKAGQKKFRRAWAEHLVSIGAKPENLKIVK